MSQAGILNRNILPPGSGTVQSVSGGNNITITGTPTVNPIVNVSGTTNHAVQVGNALGALTSIPVGLTGQVLTGVTGSDPVFAAAPASGISTLTGNTGGPVSPTLGNVNIVTANSTVEFAGAGSTLTLDFGLRNLFLGTLPTIGVADENVSIGFNAGLSITDAIANVIIGFNAGGSLTDGVENVIIGDGAMASATASTGENVAIGGSAMQNFSGSSGNVAVGFQSLISLVNGSNNCALGIDAGSSYNGSESDNILILNNGQNGENATTRIGTNGAQTACFIAGIDAVDLSTANIVTEVSDQLGTAVLTAGSGITITPGAGIITIDASGTPAGTYAYTNVNTTPYVVLITDVYISVDSSGGVRTIQLPNAATLGQFFVIKDRTGSAAANNITVTTVGGAVNIDGATTFVMNTAYESIQVIGNGTTYEVF